MLKKMVKKLIGGTMLAVMAITSLAVPVNAANTSDTAFNFDFSGWWYTSNTEGREKHNDSSVYVNCTQCPAGGFQVYVDGSNSRSGGWTDRTIRTAFIKQKGEYLIRNYVYENDERYARLGACKWGANVNAKGWWSPDSVGSYYVLN